LTKVSSIGIALNIRRKACDIGVLFGGGNSTVLHGLPTILYDMIKIRKVQNKK